MRREALLRFASAHGIAAESYLKNYVRELDPVGTGQLRDYGAAHFRCLWVWHEHFRLTGRNNDSRGAVRPWLALAAEHHEGWLVQRDGPPRWQPEPPEPSDLNDGYAFVAIPLTWTVER